MSNKNLKVSHNMHAFFKDVFSTYLKNKVVNEAATSDAINNDSVIPFRMTKKNVLKHWYTESVQAKSPFIGDAVPTWGTMYPFAAVTGCNLGLGEGSAGSSHAGWVEKALDNNVGAKYRVDELLRSAGPNAINTNDYIYCVDHPITSTVKNSVKYVVRDSNLYGKCANRKGRLVQQFCDIDKDGKLVLTDHLTSNVVIDDVKGVRCQLVSILEADPKFIMPRFGISDADSCVRFFNEIIVPQIKNQIVFAQNQKNVDPRLRTSFNPSKFGNDNYCKYIDFFAKAGCTTNGQIDGNKCREYCKSVGPEKFFKEVVLEYALQSDPAHTFVWMPLGNGTSATEKNIKIYELLKTSEIFNLGAKNVMESVVTEAAPITTGENGDLSTSYSNFSEAFFASMVYMMQNTNVKKEIITFPTDNQDNLMMLNGDVINQIRSKSVNGRTAADGVRVFITIDNISDDHNLDFTPFFRDARFKGKFEKGAPKKFFYRVISGEVNGFNLDFALEEERERSMEMARVKHEKGVGTVSEFFNAYKAEHGDETPKDQSFSVIIMRPEGDESDINSYFFFTGFGKPVAKFDETIGDMTEDEAKMVEEMKIGEDSGLSTYIWYNGATERSKDRKLIASHGADLKKDRAGKAVG